MRTLNADRLHKWLAGAAGAALLAAIGGLAFAMWMEHGAGIFLSMAQSGLAWCF